MHHVGKPDVSGEVVHPDPLRGILLENGRLELLNLRIGGRDDLMTSHAGGEGRKPRFRANFGGEMTVETLHLILSGVYVVAVENGLPGARQTQRVDVHRSDVAFRFRLVFLCCDGRGTR
jgi:hypothetical protein